jgi:hypothetical protein
VNLLVGRARIFVYYIRYKNVRAGTFGPIEPSAQITRVAHVQRDNDGVGSPTGTYTSDFGAGEFFRP